LVVRYSFLWSHEQAVGAEEGGKDRPCAIVVAARLQEDGAIITFVSPVTHSPPDDADSSLEIPSAVCKSLGLDAGRHWLRLDELNEFAWPGYDLRPIPGTDEYAYGMLPQALFEQLYQGIVRRQLARRTRVQRRDT
jgi:hypothetical protein